MDWIQTYLNKPEVKKQLGVPKYIEFQSCNFDVNRSFMGQGDSMHNSADPAIPNLLDSGVSVLIYAGKADFMCNYIGNKKWVEQLPHALGKEIAQSGNNDWYFNGQKAASYKLAKQGETQLAFLEIEEASHMVPMSQPEFSINFFNQWIYDQAFNSTSI